jgi:hypothetical protein
MLTDQPQGWQLRKLQQEARVKKASNRSGRKISSKEGKAIRSLLQG